MLKTLALAGMLVLAMTTAHAGSPIDCLRAHELAHAGGWGPDHPGAIYTVHCGHLPMPPHKFPLNGVKVIWHYGPVPCGNCQAITYMSNPAHIYLPVDPNGNRVQRR